MSSVSVSPPCNLFIPLHHLKKIDLDIHPQRTPFLLFLSLFLSLSLPATLPFLNLLLLFISHFRSVRCVVFFHPHIDSSVPPCSTSPPLSLIASTVVWWKEPLKPASNLCSRHRLGAISIKALGNHCLSIVKDYRHRLKHNFHNGSLAGFGRIGSVCHCWCSCANGHRNPVWTWKSLSIR